MNKRKNNKNPNPLEKEEKKAKDAFIDWTRNGANLFLTIVSNEENRSKDEINKNFKGNRGKKRHKGK